MDFFKAHGTGNDFVVLADLDDRLDLDADLVRAICDRHTGIGADGILRIAPSTGDAHVVMDYRNADGGVVEMCGNGVRVVAKHVLDHELVEAPDGALVIGTPAGDRTVEARRGADGLVREVRVDMGPPEFRPDRVPFRVGEGEDPDAVRVDGVDHPVLTASMGNPHAVLLVDDVDAAPVTTLGPAIERHERFPSGVNVEFVERVDDHRVRTRVWERGVGETLACGTGACAVHAVLHRTGRAGDRLDVELRGGTLVLEYDPDRHPSVFMTGPAVEVARGTLDERWIAAVRDRGAA